MILIVSDFITGTDELLGLSDTVLDETLAEDHDKNMFDEHLGLKKEADEQKHTDNPASTSNKDQKEGKIQLALVSNRKVVIQIMNLVQLNYSCDI